MNFFPFYHYEHTQAKHKLLTDSIEYKTEINCYIHHQLSSASLDMVHHLLCAVSECQNSKNQVLDVE